MKLSESAIAEYQNLCEQLFGIKLSPVQAEEEGLQLVELVKRILVENPCKTEGE